MTRHILVVEDNPITRKMIRIALESGGHAVVEAGTGAAALEAVAAESPDLVILDYVLPDMDGLQILEAIRQGPRGAATPVLMLTGMVSLLERLRERAGAFTTFLPKPVEPSRLLAVADTLLTGPTPAASGESQQPPRRVLVVDDDPVNRKLTSLRLRSAGFEVEVASSGMDAIDRAHGARPDVILSDVLMPGMDGFLLCRELQRNPELATIPVVLLSSAYDQEADRALALEMGAHALVVRSPELDHAVQALNSALAAGRPPQRDASSNAVYERHKLRLQIQLERQLARNQSLIRRSAIQAAALSVVRGLSESLANPSAVPEVLGDVLVHCLDAAGLSTGALYLVGDDDGRLGLRAHTGLTQDSRQDAEGCFGQALLFERALQTRRAVGYTAGVSDPADADARALSDRMGRRSFLVVPLRVLEHRIGCLLLASDEHDLAEGTWVGFAAALATQFGQAAALGQSLRRLSVSEERLRALMEHANDAVVILTLDGRILQVNRAAERLLGRGRESMAGRLYSDLLVPEEHEEALQSWQELAARGSVRAEARHLVRGDGTRVPVDLSAAVVAVAGEEPAVMTILRDISERVRAEEALRASEARFRKFAEIIPEVFWILDPRGPRIEYVSAAYDEIWGRPRTALYEDVRAWLEAVVPEDRAAAGAHFARWLQGEETEHEFRIRRPDGSVRTLWNRAFVSRGSPGGSVENIVGLAVDVTERKHLEQQMRQSQRMEAVGRLAGGVAHDFNNLLGVIIGYGESTLRVLPPEHTARPKIDQILRAGGRAAGLTRQLLTFSRKQVVAPRILALDTIVGDIEKMLRTVIGEDIELRSVCAPDLGRIRADPGEVEQILMNLAVNARDAMPKGGRLTIETANVDVDELYERTHSGPRPGRYAMMAVTDTGVGIPLEIQTQIFEPFFTTKEVGKGTGLGLATVYGIVQQGGGHIAVYSKPGLGACFKVYFPRVDSAAEAAEPLALAPIPGGSETILVVEDEHDLKLMTQELLQERGYRVLTAGNGIDALEVSRAHAGKIDLLITDVIMPGMGGRDLAVRLEGERPDLRVLYVSGYTDDAIVHHGVLSADLAFMQKPFTSEGLARKVRELLG
jgi:two-component system, cell cycle sensor histidine kinase and response regulator CckA